MSASNSTILRASGAQTATPGTETGDAVKFQRIYAEGIFILDVTALADDVDDTLDVYIDTSYDGGISWVNIIHFTQVLGNGTAKKEVAHIDEHTTSIINVTADAASGAVRALELGDRVRYRSTVVDPTGADASFTFSLLMYQATANGR